jgi:uncharacterized protein involved in exopolysaccharide biosynthesis
MAAENIATGSTLLTPSFDLPARLPDDVVDWMGFLRRHFLAMATTWVVVTGAAVYVVFNVLPKEYHSEAKFLVRNARQELVVGPTAGQVTQSSSAGVTEEVLNTEVELLRSRDILAQVVEKLDLGRGYVEAGRPPNIATELAMRDLSATLVSGPIRRTNLVQVSYLSQSPELAASVVQEITNAYLAAHLAVHSSPGTYEMFKTQAAEAAAELRQAEEALAALGRSDNLLNLDTQKKDALEAVSLLTRQLDALAAEMREQSTRAKVADIQLASVPERVPTARRNVPNQYSVERLHTMLVELNNKRTELLTKFNSDDRMVIELDQQIADTTSAMERAQGISANEETTDVNPAWQALVSERMKAQLALSGLESKNEQLRRELAQRQKAALDFTEAGPEYDAAVRRVTAARANHELYAKREEEARIAEVLDRQRISNVVLAQAPVVSYVPAKPNKRLGVVAGAIAAGVLALGLAFLREIFGSGARRRRQAEMQLTVLGISADRAELR